MVSTTISVDIDYQLYPWLQLGQISLNSRTLGNQGTIWILSAYLGEHTDQEHDSANIVRFEVVGLELGHIGYGMTHLTGWIKPGDLSSFRVPPPGYDPLKGATKCKMCKKPAHLMVQEGFYVPRENEELYKILSGCSIKITTGVVWPEEK